MQSKRKNAGRTRGGNRENKMKIEIDIEDLKKLREALNTCFYFQERVGDTAVVHTTYMFSIKKIDQASDIVNELLKKVPSQITKDVK